MKYTQIKKYKYCLAEDFTMVLPYDFGVGEFDWAIILGTSITIKRGYCWDGASGGCPDFKSIMRGALVHDALYQMIRLKVIDINMRLIADEVLYECCIEDGMYKLVAKTVKKAVNTFGGVWINKGDAVPKVITLDFTPKSTAA